MVTFSPDRRFILVVNEGEPNDAYSVDPEGSVSIIDLKRGLKRARVKTADFKKFNRKKEQLVAAGIRIFGPEATVAQDLEPEYIAMLPHSPFAWVSLQENNAIAKMNASGKVATIIPLGYKDHGQAIDGLDASDKDDAINIMPYEGVLGMYQPDAIAAYRVRNQTYLVTANEGDARDYDAFGEEERVENLTLDPEAFPNSAHLQEESVLGRLTQTDTLGDIDNDGDYDKLYAFGGRSFSILKYTRHGLKKVFDSGDQFEQITGAVFPADFNSTNDENDSFDTILSPDKGPEPEGLAIGAIGRHTYAFIGLERIGGIMVYDITSPAAPEFVQYINNRDFSGDAEEGTPGDLGPEGITFISAQKSSNGRPMLAVSNEVSGSTTLYQIDIQEEDRSWQGHGKKNGYWDSRH